MTSHFVNELRLPWIWGARFLEWRLIDAHPALNIVNCPYPAGVDSDPRHFGDMPRRFDPERQMGLDDSHPKHLQRWPCPLTPWP